MSRVLSVLMTMMMVQASMGFLAAGLAQAPEHDEPFGPVDTTITATYGHGRLSRAYQDLSTWRGFANKTYSVSYLVVTVDAFVDSVIPLVQWKTEKGYNSAIVTVEDIYQAYTGQDDAQKIHNYLRDFRDNNPTFKWLLLLGDSDEGNVFVPDRHLWTGAYYIDWYIQNSTVSDFYYSALDSSWNLDGDNTWGETAEVDWTPDIYVGRIPANSVANSVMNINKIIKYEKDPFMGSWMNRALLASALYDAPNVIGDYSTRMHEGYYEWWQDNGKEATDVIKSEIPSSMAIKELHDYNVTPEGNPPHYWGGNYTTPKDELNQVTFVNEFNKGYSIIATASHAWVWAPVSTVDFISRGIIDYDGNGSNVVYHEFYYWTDARDAVNMDMLPLWYASACIVGNWSTASFVPEETFEQFFRNQNGGGVIGLVAASHGDYRGEQDSYTVSDGDTWLHEDFWKQFFTTGEFRAGQTLYLNKIGYRNHLKNDLGYTNQVMDGGFARDSMFVYNLLGDPEVPVWTALPSTLTATIPANTYTGKSTIEIFVKDKFTGKAVKDATVALWGPTQYTSAKTDFLGRATLTTNGAVPEKVNVTITAHNYKFMQHYLNITWKPADLTITSDNITFSKDLVKAGEEITISAKVFNIGETGVSGIEVKFYLGDPNTGGTEIGATSITGLAPHISSVTSIPWTVVDGIKTICVVVDPLLKIAEFSEANNKACKTIEGTSKDMVIWPTYITFDQAYTMKDGTPEVGNGTFANVRVAVENKGTTAVTSTYLRLFDGDPTAGGKRIGSADYRLDNITAGGFANRTVEWNVTTPGMHTIFVIVDPTNLIKEYDENNNNASTIVWSDLPPTMSVIDDIIMDEDDQRPSALCMFSYVDDPDNQFDELFLKVTSNSNPNVVVNFTKGCVDIFPKQDFFGFTQVTMEVFDGVFKASRTFRITVTAVNDEPRITNPGKVTAQEGVPFDYTVATTDPEGSPLSFTDDSPLFVIDEKTGKIKFTPTRDMRGQHVVKVTVSDGELTASVTFTIVVNVNNRVPVLEIKEKEWIFTVGKAKKFTFTVNDPDNDPVTVTDNFMFADVNKAGYLAYTPMKNQTGTHNVTITASDGMANVSKTVLITIKDKPTIETIGGLTMQMLAILLIVIILIIAIIAAVALMRSRKKVDSGHGKEYDNLYAADEKRRQQQEAERRREERIQRRLEEERRAQEEVVMDEGAYASEQAAEETEAPPVDKCPKCGSSKIKKMGPNEWMCMRCSKIF